MEAIIILLLLALLAVPVILLIWVKISTSSLIKELIHKVNSLYIKIDKLDQKEIDKEIIPDEDNVSINESLLTLMETLPEDESSVKATDLKEEENIEDLRKKWGEEKVEAGDKKKEARDKRQEERGKRQEGVRQEEKPFRKAAFKKPKKQKRDIEKFIGENLINKIGIGILVLGIAYFVRYAIDKEWINEVGRVAIGILSGGLLSLFAHRIRKTFKAFSSVLVGGAMAVFYYTISIGFHDYHLFSQTLAFGLMVLITGFSVLLSISYDKKELAILGLVGAFSTPIMLSNGSGNYMVLFSYLAIVNVGMLVLAYFKKWNVVNILSFAFTVLLYGTWFTEKVIDVARAPYRGAFLFASLFYIIFFFMHIINNVKEKRKFKGYEFGLMLSTTALFYGAGMAILHLSGHDNMRGLFTIGLGLFNLLFAFPLYKRQNVDKSLIFLLIGIVLTFVSLAAPVQLEGNYITLFWTTEMVLLLWLGQKSKIKFIKLSALLILALMLISLVMDWQQIYFDFSVQSLPIIFNKGFITTAFSLLGIGVFFKLLKNETENSLIKGVHVQLLQNTIKIVFMILAYFIGFFEISFQMAHRIDYMPVSSLAILGYTYLFLLGLSIYAQKRNYQVLSSVLIVISAVAVGTYPLFNGLTQVIRDDYLLGQTYFWSFALQYVVLTVIVVVAIRLLMEIKRQFGLRSEIGKITVWIMSLLALVVASMQLNHQTMLLFFDYAKDNMAFINKQTIKIAYPIVWGISSFVLMLIGMKYKYRTLRVISLSVFSVILIKLFLFDIKGASEAGKIVAFILLGVLLLVISFMYQKLKNLILDNGKNE